MLAAGAARGLDHDGDGDLRIVAGAKAMNQTVLRPATPVSAVPGLAGDATPGIWAAVPVPLATAALIIVVSCGRGLRADRAPELLVRLRRG